MYVTFLFYIFLILFIFIEHGQSTSWTHERKRQMITCADFGNILLHAVLSSVASAFRKRNDYYSGFVA